MPAKKKGRSGNAKQERGGTTIVDDGTRYMLFTEDGKAKYVGNGMRYEEAVRLKETSLDPCRIREV